MKSWTGALAMSLLVLTAVVALLITAAWFSLPLDGITISVHGRTFPLAELPGPQVAVALSVAVAAVVVAIVVALVMVVVGSVVGALGLAFGVLTAAASLAVVLSPFALIAWLLWRVWRDRPPPLAASAR